MPSLNMYEQASSTTIWEAPEYVRITNHIQTGCKMTYLIKLMGGS